MKSPSDDLGCGDLPNRVSSNLGTSKMGSELSNPILLRLISQAQPHKVIVFIATKCGVKPHSLILDKAQASLVVLLQEIETTLRSTSAFVDFIPWAELLRQNMPMRYDEFVFGNHLRRSHSHVLPLRTSEITLKSCFSDDPTEDVADWVSEIEDCLLVSKIGWGSQNQRSDAFAELHTKYNRNVEGYCKGRGVASADVGDVAQRIWLEVWNQLSEMPREIASENDTNAKFHPGRGTFRQYLLQRAEWRADDYHRKAKASREVTEDHPGEGASGSLVLLTDEYILARCMETIFGGNNPPHQLLAFGFVQLLEYKPTEFADWAGYQSLASLVSDLERELANHFPVHIIVKSFSKLQEVVRGASTVHQVLTGKTGDLYGYVANLKMGETWLADYCTKRCSDDNEGTRLYRARAERFLGDVRQEVANKDYQDQFSANITNWWVTVRKRVLRDLEAGGFNQ